MNTPLISIITVVRNGVSTLEQTILSVINQTYKNIEYIIIDGGSTDGTVDIIKKYENHLACWVSEPDKGIYDAMNKGIDKATGEWINFMNSGDWFYSKSVLTDIFNNKETVHSDVIYGSYYSNIYGKSKITHIKHSKINNIKKKMPFCHQTAFTKSNIITYFDTRLKISADYDFFYKLYNNGYQFEETDIDVAFYDGNGSSFNNFMLYSVEKFIIRKRYNKNMLYNLYLFMIDLVYFLLILLKIK
jgi:glycosyltransferase involved in cell wall biosynthesis